MCVLGDVVFLSRYFCSNGNFKVENKFNFLFSSAQLIRIEFLSGRVGHCVSSHLKFAGGGRGGR